jgi:CheY-like chemotaxis protein
MLLRLMGNEVRTVHDGIKAVEEAATFRPDVILLDIGMPRLNGYDAARLIREQRWSNGTMIVALTGWGQDEDKRRATEAGFDRHFTKPLDPAALQKLIGEFRAD